MSAEIGVSQQEPGPATLDGPLIGLWARPAVWRWEFAVGLIAVIASGVAIWITLRAHFLAYPGWLAVQKADFIIGPIGVGLYWQHRRPNSRLGLLLIVLGLAGIPYILASVSNPTLFGLGAVTELPIYVMTSAVILAFPTGRIEGVPAKAILAVVVIANIVVTTVFALSDPQGGPSFSISGCRAVCPRNGLAIWSAPGWLATFGDVYGALLIAIPIATAGVLIWRFIDGTSPRRRALAIGAPIALLFLVMQASYRTLFFLSPDGLSLSLAPVHSGLQWTFAAARSFIWYGFLFALIAAELSANQVLRNVVRRSLGRPSLRELEEMLREPLGDSGLRLGFRRAGTRDWVGHDGSLLEAGPGQAVTVVERDGRPAAAIVHDKQLSDDPELLQAAGAAALLAQENAELDAAWQESLRELRGSRARLASATERERRKLEHDLHDGAQQRLVAAAINLTLADEASDERERHDRIAASHAELDQALSELREIAHGIYPTALARSGLSRAFEWLARRDQDKVTVTEATVGRFSPEIELAVYYCCLEAVQNASKHAGPQARVWIRLYIEADELRLEVRDSGRGFDVAQARDGIGLQNMRDRLGSVGGRVEIRSEPGGGTLVVASAPVSTPRGTRPTNQVRSP